MSHPSLDRWLDYGRELLPEKERAAMSLHLESGCERCSGIVSFLEKVARASGPEVKISTPPADLAGMAKRVFQPSSEFGLSVALRQVLALLVYDSFADPQPEGARSIRSGSRQLLFEAGDYALDFRLETERGRKEVILIGQIVNRANPDSSVSLVPVELLSGAKLLGETTSNEFGEFVLECTPRKKLRLRVPLTATGERVEVTLDRFLESHES